MAKSIWTPGLSGSPIENTHNLWQRHGGAFLEFNNANNMLKVQKKSVNNPPIGSNAKVRPNDDVMICEPKSINCFKQYNSVNGLGKGLNLGAGRSREYKSTFRNSPLTSKDYTR